MPETMPQRYPAFSERVGEETLVFVPSSHQAHLLNDLASRVYECCDSRPLDEVEAELGEEALWLALRELSSRKLVPETSRREFLKKAAVLSLVTSVLIPEPAMAASCVAIPSPGCPVLSDPPDSCLPCCGPSGGCITDCPDCSVCTCLQFRSCFADQTTPCDLSGICPTDIAVNHLCVGSPGGRTLCATNPAVCQETCDFARSEAVLAGSPLYACCRGCSGS